MTATTGFEWQGLAAVLADALPSPLLVLDQEVRLQAFNRAAEPLLSGPLTLVLNRRCGSAIGCVNHALASNGCGTSEVCADCPLRHAVTQALGGEPVRRERTLVQRRSDNGSPQDIHLLLTAAPLEHQGRRLVLVILEDISELTALKSIIPICSYCKRVRTDDEYWAEVEVFLHEHLNADVSHGICPECYDLKIKALGLAKR